MERWLRKRWRDLPSRLKKVKKKLKNAHCCIDAVCLMAFLCAYTYLRVCTSHMSLWLKCALVCKAFASLCEEGVKQTDSQVHLVQWPVYHFGYCCSVTSLHTHIYTCAHTARSVASLTWDCCVLLLTSREAFGHIQTHIHTHSHIHNDLWPPIQSIRAMAKMKDLQAGKTHTTHTHTHTHTHTLLSIS